MTSTLYQYQTRVDRTAGSYRYDCVGFVSYALKRAAPQAWDSAFKATGIAKGRIPSPPRYRAFFASLAEAPQPGWEAVIKASELRPGDVVAWEQKTETAVGHAVVIKSAPVPGLEGTWLVEVYDSTSTIHAPRTTAPRCWLPMAGAAVLATARWHSPPTQPAALSTATAGAPRRRPTSSPSPPAGQPHDGLAEGIPWHRALSADARRFASCGFSPLPRRAAKTHAPRSPT